MKLISYLAPALLGASSAAASSIPKNEARQLDVPIGTGPGGDCTGGFYLGPDHIPPPGFNFFTFCSSYLQLTLTETSLVTSTAVQTVTRTNTPPTVLTTSTKYSTTSQTSVVTVTTIYATTVVVTSRSTSTKPTVTTTTSPGIPQGTLCPVADGTPQSCGVSGWGYAENNIYYAKPVSAALCHQLCLGNPNCASFQVQADNVASPECNLYNVAVSPDTVIEGNAPFVFYDRNCPDYSPSTCNKREAAFLVKKDDSNLPDFLIGVDLALLDALCTCLLPPPEPAYTTVTQTVLVTQTNTATVQGRTSTSAVTVTVGVTTVISVTTTVARSSTVTRTTTIIV